MMAEVWVTTLWVTTQKRVNYSFKKSQLGYNYILLEAFKKVTILLHYCIQQWNEPFKMAQRQAELSFVLLFSQIQSIKKDGPFLRGYHE